MPDKILYIILLLTPSLILFSNSWIQINYIDYDYGTEDFNTKDPNSYCIDC